MDTRSPLVGHFKVKEKEYAGLLTLAGSESQLEIYSPDFLALTDDEMKQIQGISKDGVRFSAVNCIGPGVPGTASYYGERRHFISVFPNLVALGPRFIAPDQNQVASIAFTFSRANKLFYDWGTFGSIHDAKLSYSLKRKLLNYVKRSPKHRRRGGSLDLHFHWNRGPIIKIDDGGNTIRAYNATTTKMPSSSGISVTNNVRIEYEFAHPTDIEQALARVFELRSFFEVMSQSRQNIEDVTLMHKEAEMEGPLELYLPNLERDEVEDLHPGDALINGGLQPEEFEGVLGCWLKTNKDNGAARRRFVEGFRQNHVYDVDRLIAAANAFDLLPSGSLGGPVDLGVSVESFLADLEKQVRAKSAQDTSIQEYKDQFLSSLGRIRGLTLRSKILSRYSTIPEILKARLPDMQQVIRHCVWARNYFVHGSEPSLPPEDTYEHAPFFTDTLEFVFAVSELRSCGWNIDRWIKEPYGRSRLKSYMHGYKERKELLFAAVEPDK